MLSEEKIRERAKARLKRYFNFEDQENKHMSARYIAMYEALVSVLELTTKEEDDLWEEAANEYYKKKSEGSGRKANNEKKRF